MSLQMVGRTETNRTYYVEDDAANLRLLVGRGACQQELWGSASKVLPYVLKLSALIECFDADGFCDALPGEGYLVSEHGGAAAWTCIFAYLHHTSAHEDQCPIEPIFVEELKIQWFCVPSEADLHVIVGDVGDSWELICSCDMLRNGSEYFACALRPNTWCETQAGVMKFPCDFVSDWQLALRNLHNSNLCQPELPRNVNDLVRFIAFCKKYLLHSLERASLEALREENNILCQLVRLIPHDFVQLSRELLCLNELSPLLGPWCVICGSSISAHVAALLYDDVLARAVLASRGAAEFVCSETFLSSVDVLKPDGLLGRIVAIDGLEMFAKCRSWSWVRGPADLEFMLSEDDFLPLLQLSSLREELRQTRFRDASLESILSPFPMLFDDLLESWFKRDDLSAGNLSPTDLAKWADCKKFCRRGFLQAQIEKAIPKAKDVVDFAKHAPLNLADVAMILRSRVASIAREAWTGFCRQAPDADSLLTDPELLRRLCINGAIGWKELLLLALAEIMHRFLRPWRSLASFPVVLHVPLAQPCSAMTVSRILGAWRPVLRCCHLGRLRNLAHTLCTKLRHQADTEFSSARKAAAIFLCLLRVALRQGTHFILAGVR